MPISVAPMLQATRSARISFSTSASHDPLGCQAPEHRINPRGRRLRAPVEPPRQYGYVGANDILDDEFARNGVAGMLVGRCGKFVAYHIAEYLENDARGDGAAADQAPMEVDMNCSVPDVRFDLFGKTISDSVSVIVRVVRFRNVTASARPAPTAPDRMAAAQWVSTLETEPLGDDVTKVVDPNLPPETTGLVLRHASTISRFG